MDTAKRMVTLEQMASELKAANNIVICGHVSPDGDCLGSALALAAALRKLDKDVTCLLARDEHIDYGLRFIDGIQDMIPAKDYTGEIDTFVSVDVPHADRMGLDAKYLHSTAKNTLTIDHHQFQDLMSCVNYVDEQSPATAMIIWDLVSKLGVEYDSYIATCCYVGLMTDTGRFAYQNTTSEAFRMAEQMVAAGVQPADIACHVYQNRSRASLALEKRMIERVEFFCNGQVAMSYLKRSDFVETNGIKADAEPLIDVIRSIRGIRVACMLREQDGQVRGSLRAKDTTDVSLLADKFGGGGHKAAAGFTVRGSMSDVRRLVSRELVDLF